MIAYTPSDKADMQELLCLTTFVGQPHRWQFPKEVLWSPTEPARDPGEVRDPEKCRR